MRLILALLLLASPVFGAVADGTMALWFDTTQCAAETSDATGNYNLTEIGDVTYDGTNNPPIGTSSASNFVASTNYYTNAGISNALYASKDSWTIQFYSWQTTQGGIQVLFSFGTFSIQFSGDEVYIDDSGFPFFQTSNMNITAGSWIHIAITYDGTDIRVYKDNVLKDTGTRASISDPSGAVAYFGIYINALFPALVQFNQFRISNTVETSFPTVDPSGGSPRRGFDLDLDMDLSKVFENGIGWLSSLFTTRLEAYPAYSDDWKAWKAKKDKEVKADKTQKAIAAELTKIAKFCEKPKGNCSPTPTPTMSPTITQTPNPAQLSVTATATPTPTATATVTPTQ